jgi:hypothetical protein
MDLEAPSLAPPGTDKNVSVSGRGPRCFKRVAFLFVAAAFLQLICAQGPAT